MGRSSAAPLPAPEAEALAVGVEEAAVEGVVGAGDEGGLVGSQEQSQGSDFLGLAHAADGLRRGKLLKHFLFAAGIIFAEIAVDEGCVHAGGRDAIATDFVREVIPGDGVS